MEEAEDVGQNPPGGDDDDPESDSEDSTRSTQLVVLTYKNRHPRTCTVKECFCDKADVDSQFKKIANLMEKLSECRAGMCPNAVNQLYQFGGMEFPSGCGFMWVGIDEDYNIRSKDNQLVKIVIREAPSGSKRDSRGSRNPSPVRSIPSSADDGLVGQDLTACVSSTTLDVASSSARRSPSPDTNQQQEVPCSSREANEISSMPSTSNAPFSSEKLMETSSDDLASSKTTIVSNSSAEVEAPVSPANATPMEQSNADVEDINSPEEDSASLESAPTEEVGTENSISSIAAGFHSPSPSIALSSTSSAPAISAENDMDNLSNVQDRGSEATADELNVSDPQPDSSDEQYEDFDSSEQPDRPSSPYQPQTVIIKGRKFYYTFMGGEAARVKAMMERRRRSPTPGGNEEETSDSVQIAATVSEEAPSVQSQSAESENSELINTINSEAGGVEANKTNDDSSENSTQNIHTKLLRSMIAKPSQAETANDDSDCITPTQESSSANNVASDGQIPENQNDVRSSSVPQEAGVTTRSRASRAAPASVKRKLEARERELQKIASTKMSASYAPSVPSDASASSTRDDGSSCSSSGNGKRLRSSDVDSDGSASNRNKRRHIDDMNENRRVLQAHELWGDAHVDVDQGSSASKKRKRVPTTTKCTDKTAVGRNNKQTSKENTDQAVFASKGPEVDLESSDAESVASGDSSTTYASNVTYNDRIKQRRERENKRANKPVAVIEGVPSSSKRPSLFESAKKTLKDIKAGKLKEKTAQQVQREPQVTNDDAVQQESLTCEDDDDIEMVDVLPSKSVSKMTGNKHNSESNQICIKLPGSSLKTASNPAAADKAKSLPKTPLPKPNSIRPSLSAIAGSPAEQELELEQDHRWEGGVISSSQKSAGPAMAHTKPPEKSVSEKTGQGPSKPKSGLERRLSSDSGSSEKSRRSSGKEGGSSESSLRDLRAPFDPVQGAVKIVPKQVPKVTKETIKSITNKTNAIASPQKQVHPGSFQKNVPPPERTLSGKSQPAARQTEESDDVTVVSEEASQKGPLQQAGKHSDIEILTMPEKTKQPEAAQRVSENTLSDENKDRPSNSNQSLQRPTSSFTSRPSEPPAKSKDVTPTFVDGEFRLIKTNNPNSRDSSADSESNKSTLSGNWIRGDRQPSNSGDRIDFENPPEENKDRREGRQNQPDRSRNRSGSGSPKGRGHPHHYNNYNSNGRRNRGHGQYRGGPRAPYRGGPPRGNQINTVITHQGRYQNQPGIRGGPPVRLPHPPPLLTQQIPPPFMDPNFATHFSPSLTSPPPFLCPPEGQLNFFPNNQYFQPTRFPRFQ